MNLRTTLTCCCLVLACGPLDATSSDEATETADGALTLTNPRLQWFGHYAVTGLGNFIDEVSDHSNIAQVTSDIEDVVHAQAVGLLPLVSIGDLFFAEQGPVPGCTSKRPFSRRTVPGTNTLDLTLWNGFRDQVFARGAQHFIAFYNLDEPNNHCLDGAKLEEVGNVIHQSFPGAPIMVTYGHGQGGEAGAQLPPSHTWFSFDTYGAPSQTNYRARMAALAARLQPHQDLFVTSQGFTGANTDAVDGAEVVRRLNAYSKIANAQPRVVGILNFLWPSVGGMHGTRDRPKIRAAATALGLQIRAN